MLAVAVDKRGHRLDATDSKAQVAVVTHVKGIDFLLDGAQDKNGNPITFRTRS